MANYDIIGNIAIVKFSDADTSESKLKKAQEIMNQYKGIRTVLEKSNKVSGRLRTIKTNFILGEDTREALYVENGCRFKLNVETCYFSPRLAGERLEVAKKIKSKDKVLVMFSGVGPFSIVVGKHTRCKKIVCIELGKECCRYASLNVKMNKLENIEVIRGDVKKIIPKLIKGGLNVKGNLVPLNFDVVLMPRPNLRETFLSQALKVSKKGTKIIYYGFSPESKKDKMVSDLIA